MAIACPYCDHAINLRSPKPGRYRPHCPNCAKPFLLTVPEQHEVVCAVGMIADEAKTNSGIEGFPPSRENAIQDTVLRPPLSGAVMPSAVANSSFELARTTPDKIAQVAAPAPKAPVAKTSGAKSKKEDDAPPRVEIRGYQIERELGRGGMGAVYLARQMSLGRSVALKVMSKKWASDPVFAARFLREAFAAAQLSHPNIVHIHDIGEVDGSRFFSMEYVNGPTLADVVKNQGKLDAETAVGYILQAARGLKHAHDRGMIHRDVKPDNLLLDDQGVIKVADLGLVKTGDAPSEPRDDVNTVQQDLTGERIALGTPAYMSPEQCRDAAKVDLRADIYSLGCTLYVLVTGRPPFDGNTAVELMSKHAYEPMVPPEQIVSRVPAELSAVIQRMMAKNADDRFANMGEVIRTLEAWLGVRHAAFCPQEDQINRIEKYVHAFNAAPTATLRNRLIRSFFSAVLLAVVLLPFFDKYTWAFGVVGLALQATLAYFILDGIARKTHLFTRVRELVFGMSWGDYLVVAASLTLFGILLWMLNVFWMWLGFGAVGVVLALALRYGLDRKVEAERRGPLDSCERLLRKLRLQGLDEDDLQQFVAKFAGRNWEAFFEELFGYEAKLNARFTLLRGGSAGHREKYAAWREPLIQAIDSVQRSRKEAHERKLLLAVERANLIAAGVSPEDAEGAARAAADAMVRGAEAVRVAETQRAGPGYQTGMASTPASVRDIVRAAEQSASTFFTPTKPATDPIGPVVWFFVGPHVRALAAIVLLVCCGMWIQQNGLIPGTTATQQVSAAQGTTQPLTVYRIEPRFTAWVNSFNVGIAGLLLLGSLVFRGNTMSLFVVLGAVVAVTGHQLGIRSVEPFRDYHVSLMLGTALALVGFRAGSR